jgi:plastocyanin
VKLVSVMAAGALALVAPVSARADVATVAIPGKSFSPAAVTVVAGDSVAWRNSDFTAHDVRATDGAFDSGPLGRFGAFAQAFAAVGVHPFYCSIHPFMTGSVDVVAAALTAPARPAFAGEPVALKGRAPAGTASVAVERLDPDGAWRAAGSASPAADGTFAATVRPAATTSYRARTALGESPAVTVAVSAGVKLHVAVTAHAVKVRARPGLVVTVQRWARWRFDWRVAARARLDAHGRATVRLGIPMRGKARVLLSRTPRGPALVTGDPLFLRTGARTHVP